LWPNATKILLSVAPFSHILEKEFVVQTYTFHSEFSWQILSQSKSSLPIILSSFSTAPYGWGDCLNSWPLVCNFKLACRSRTSNKIPLECWLPEIGVNCHPFSLIIQTCALRWLPQLWSSIFENFLVKGQKCFVDFFELPIQGIYIPCPYPSSLGFSKEKTSSQHWFDPQWSRSPHPTNFSPCIVASIQIANLLYINSILGKTSFWAIYYFLGWPSTISSHLLGVFSWRIWPIASRVGYE